jgi:hypothetical protein
MRPERNDGKKDDQRIDDLLARDRKMLSHIANERIASGLYRRIIQSQAHDQLQPGSNVPWRWRWALAGAVIAIAVAGLWLRMPRKTTSPNPEIAARAPAPGTATATGVVEIPLTRNDVKKSRSAGSHTRPAHRAVADPHQTVVPKQAAFPSDLAPNAQERLLMQLAESKPEHLSLIAKAMDEDARQHADHQRAFEEWLKEGEKR